MSAARGRGRQRAAGGAAFNEPGARRGVVLRAAVVLASRLALAPCVHPDVFVSACVLAVAVGGRGAWDAGPVLRGPCAAFGPCTAVLGRLVGAGAPLGCKLGAGGVVGVSIGRLGIAVAGVVTWRAWSSVDRARLVVGRRVVAGRLLGRLARRFVSPEDIGTVKHGDPRRPADRLCAIDVCDERRATKGHGSAA